MTVLILALLMGCADPDPGVDTDTEVDTEDVDTEPDTEADTEPDTEADTEPDTDADTTPTGPVDADDDGLTDRIDCDDSDPDVGGPVAFYLDADGDSYGDATRTTTACTVPAHHVVNNTDCNDLDPAISPGADEVCNNGVDDDCDTLSDLADTDLVDAQAFFVDADGDGFGVSGTTVMACEATLNLASQDGDCDDTDRNVAPDQPERCGTVGVDDDCNGSPDDDGAIDVRTFYADSDTDSWGDPNTQTHTCTAPDGFVAVALDCAPDNTAIHPDAPELCNDTDDDCDGNADLGATDAPTWYLDADDDDHGIDLVLAQACPQYAPAFAALASGDCDDNNALVNPAQPERCSTVGVDDNCDTEVDGPDAIDLTTVYQDLDGDGFGDADSAVQVCALADGLADNADDCDDSAATVYPGAIELCDGEDTDCAGGILEVNVPGEYPTIQGAIDDTADGGLVCVGPGEWTETLDYGGHNVRVVSLEGAATTTLVGDEQGPVVRFENGETAQAALEGFRLRAGGYSPGRGLFLHIQEAHPVVRDVVVKDEFGSINGDNCYSPIALVFSDALLERVHVWDLRLRCETGDAGGIAAIYGAPTLRDVSVVNTDVSPAGLAPIAMLSTAATLDGVFISDNWSVEEDGMSEDYGLYLSGCDDCVVRNVTVHENRARNLHESAVPSALRILGGTVHLTNIDVSANITRDVEGIGILVQDGAEVSAGWVNVSGSGVPLVLEESTWNARNPLLGEAGVYQYILDGPFITGWEPDDDSLLIDAGDPSLLDPDGTRSDIGYSGPHVR